MLTGPAQPRCSGAVPASTRPCSARRPRRSTATPLPPIRRYGAIGHRRPHRPVRPRRLPARRGALERSPLPLASADALPFISSNALTLAEAALACADLARLLEASVQVAARTWRAAGASVEPLAYEVQRACHPGQARVAAALSALLDDHSPPDASRTPLLRLSRAAAGPRRGVRRARRGPARPSPST